MARIRTIKPEFPQSESIGRLSRDARLLFIQLWTIVDDAGRTRAASRMIASLLYPYDDDAGALVDGWLIELEGAGKIRRYVVDGSVYLEIPNWLEHQKIDKPSKSRLPSFDDGSRMIANIREASETDLGSRTSTLDLDHSASDDAKPARPPKSRKKPSVAYPSDFKPDREYMRPYGFSDVEITKEAERFKNHALSADRRCVDWQMAWRNWVIKAADFAGKSLPSEAKTVTVYEILPTDPKWEIWWEWYGTRKNDIGKSMGQSLMKQAKDMGKPFIVQTPYPPNIGEQIATTEHAA